VELITAFHAIVSIVDLRHQFVILDGQAFVILDGHAVVLTRQEYRLLVMLVQHTGEILSRAILLTQVFGYAPHAHTRTLDNHIHRLRKKLGREGRRIETIFGKGYRFSPLYNSDNPGVPDVETPSDSV
jgi:DNA-binding response OmpR family regulator